MRKKVCIHMQEAMVQFPRGIPRVVIDLTSELLKRDSNDYWLAFFDYNHERNNVNYLRQYLGNNINNANLAECNTLSFKTIIEGLSVRDDSFYDQRTYEQYVGVEPDVIYFPYSGNFPHNVTTKKVIVTIQDLMPLDKKLSSQFSESERNRAAYALEYIKNNDNILVTVTSESTRKDLLNLCDIEESRIRRIPLGYDDKKVFHQENSIVLNRFHIPNDYILYLGALDERKGLDVIIGAVELLPSDVVFVLSGKLEKNLNHKTLDRLKRHQNVIFTGYVTEEEKRILMSMAKIFVFPSYYEGFGLPILEAMACGTPVITTSVSSLPEVGGEAALYIHPGSAEELAHNIQIVLDSPKLQAEMKERGFENLKNYQWDAVAAQMEKLFDE